MRKRERKRERQRDRQRKREREEERKKGRTPAENERENNEWADATHHSSSANLPSWRKHEKLWRLLSGLACRAKLQPAWNKMWQCGHLVLRWTQQDDQSRGGVFGFETTRWLWPFSNCVIIQVLGMFMSCTPCQHRQIRKVERQSERILKDIGLCCAFTHAQARSPTTQHKIVYGVVLSPADMLRLAPLLRYQACVGATRVHNSCL